MPGDARSSPGVTNSPRPQRCCQDRGGEDPFLFSGSTAGEFGMCWGEASPPFRAALLHGAACWNVSAESAQQDSTCPGHCLDSLHNFVLPYGNLVLCSQERKWFLFVLMTAVFSSQEQRAARDLEYKAQLLLLQVS